MTIQYLRVVESTALCVIEQGCIRHGVPDQRRETGCQFGIVHAFRAALRGVGSVGRVEVLLQSGNHGAIHLVVGPRRAGRRIASGEQPSHHLLPQSGVLRDRSLLQRREVEPTGSISRVMTANAVTLEHRHDGNGHADWRLPTQDPQALLNASAISPRCSGYVRITSAYRFAASVGRPSFS